MINFIKQHKWRVFVFMLLFVGIIVGAGLLAENHIAGIKSYLLNPDSHPVGFILMFALLPILGFPILPLLIALGAKFGAEKGLVILAAGTPIHLLFSFLLSHIFLRPFLLKIALRKGITVPRFQEKRKMLIFSFFFMAIPGLSYAMKNYLLAVTNIPFRYFLIVGGFTQGALGVPFVIAGNAVGTREFIIPAVLIGLAAAFYLFLLWIKKRKDFKHS